MDCPKKFYCYISPVLMWHCAGWLSPGHPLTPSSKYTVELQLQTELQSRGHRCLRRQNRQSFQSKGKKWRGRVSEEVEGGREGRGGEEWESWYMQSSYVDQSMGNMYLHHKGDTQCGYHGNKRGHQMVTMTTMSCRELYNNSLCTLVALV